MDTMSAFARGEAARASGNKMRVFDWNRAAQLIRERQPQTASAGLGDDWEYTGGTIYENGAPVTDSYTYLASLWAIPELELDEDVQDCWKWEADTDGWDHSTKWPQSALDILNDAARSAT